VNTSEARFRYHGTGGALFGLALTNALLTLITLGVYSFWAKNKVRDFHYSHTEMDGDRFAYHGTGGELFRGYLKAMGIILLLALALGILTAILAGPGGSQVIQAALSFAFYVAIMVLVFAAINGARRYRFSRSSWRGIRFSYHGETGAFVSMMIRGTLLSIVTLGFYLPEFQNQKRAYLVTNARFGSEPFMYDGKGRDMFGAYVRAVLLTIPTLGLYWIWYAAMAHRYYWNHTTMRGARFTSSVTGGALLKLQLVNVLLVFFTLGIGAAWAITRTHAFWCDNIRLQGTMDWAAIQQQAQKSGVAAEGLADSLDVDVGIGF